MCLGHHTRRAKGCQGLNPARLYASQAPYSLLLLQPQGKHSSSTPSLPLQLRVISELSLGCKIAHFGKLCGRGFMHVESVQWRQMSPYSHLLRRQMSLVPWDLVQGKRYWQLGLPEALAPGGTVGVLGDEDRLKHRGRLQPQP